MDCYKNLQISLGVHHGNLSASFATDGEIGLHPALVDPVDDRRSLRGFGIRTHERSDNRTRTHTPGTHACTKALHPVCRCLPRIRTGLRLLARGLGRWPRRPSSPNRGKAAVCRLFSFIKHTCINCKDTV